MSATSYSCYKSKNENHFYRNVKSDRGGAERYAFISSILSIGCANPEVFVNAVAKPLYSWTRGLHALSTTRSSLTDYRERLQHILHLPILI